MGSEGFQRLMQFTQLLWCGLRRGMRVERGARFALVVDGDENCHWFRDAVCHGDGCAQRRLDNAEHRAEGRGFLFVQ